MRNARFLVPAFIAALASPAFAHPGHGELSRVVSVWHYLLEPEHVWVIAAAAVVVWAAFRVKGARKRTTSVGR
jgi:hydrogenase/urease accessory protein HupE